MAAEDNSDINDVITALKNNADYDVVNSVSKASAYVVAARQFLILSPQSQSDQGSSLTMSPASIENLMNQALDFIAANRVPSSVVRFLSVSNGFR
jgi:hypothetical protein